METRWCSVAVLVSGPEIDAAGGCAAFGDAAAVIDDLKVVEDGRLHMSVSGIALMDASGLDEPVVLTCASAFAPFFVRRPSPKTPGKRTLQPSIDDALVPTTEIFVVFPGKGGEGDEGEDMLGMAAAASLVACAPLEEAEEVFQRIQAGNKLSRTPATTSNANVCEHTAMASLLPSLGSLGIAVLRVPPNEKDPLPEDLGAHLDLHSLSEAIASLSCGREIRIGSSPFGSLKPSLFMHTEVHGAVATSPCPSSGLMLLDARCLPGSEGGVVITSNAATQCDVPVALVVPFIRGPNGDRIAVGAAVSLRAISRSVLQLLPRVVLGPVFGSKLQATMSMIAQIDRPFRELGFDEFEPTLRSFCILTSLDGSHSASALVLTATGYMLTSSSFVEQYDSRGAATKLRCRVSPHGSGSDVSHVCEFSIPHSFKSAPCGAALLHSSCDFLGVMGRQPLPYVPLQDADLHQGSTEVVAVSLSDAAGVPRLVSAILGKLIFETGAEAPTLLQCTTLAPHTESTVLLRAGPQPVLLGFGLAGTQEEFPGRVMPHSHLSLASSQLMPLLQSAGEGGSALQTDVVCGVDVRRELAQFDLKWQECSAGGVRAMVWRLESGVAPSLRARMRARSAL